MRFLILPLFLFSGTFFPLTQLPTWLQTVVWLSPLWHGVELCRGGHHRAVGPAAALGCSATSWCSVAFTAAGCRWGTRTFTARLAS